MLTSPDDPRLASLISISEMDEAMNAANGKRAPHKLFPLEQAPDLILIFNRADVGCVHARSCDIGLMVAEISPITFCSDFWITLYRPTK